MPKASADAGVAWPSPRSWDMADWLLKNGLGVESVQSAVGVPTYLEFRAYVDVWSSIPDVTPILEGKGSEWSGITLGKPSIIYALVALLETRTQNANEGMNVIKFLLTQKELTQDYVSMYIRAIILKMNKTEVAKLIKAMSQDAKTGKFVKATMQLIKGE